MLLLFPDFLSQAIPSEAVAKITKEQNIMSNQSSYFVCHASYYLIEKGLQFVIEFDNKYTINLTKGLLHKI